MKRGIINLILIIIIAVTLGAALYYSFGPEECLTFECFQQSMISCKSTTYINEEPEASWGYKIIGKKSEQCEIEVTLFSAKEGSLKLRDYEGNSMNCFYSLGISAYPERDLDSCHGELKENIQSIIIEKMHKYILENLGEISEEVGKL